MADYVGDIIGGAGTPVDYPSRIPAQHARVRQTNLPEDNLEALLADPAGTNQRFGNNLIYVDASPPAVAPTTFAGEVVDKTTFAFDWFEKFHVFPSAFVLGNILTTQNIAVTVYSAYRKEFHTWDAFINNAGAGTTLLNVPSLPAIFRPQTGTTGLILEVTPNGPPVVDTTLDFVFDAMTISPIIQLNRLVLFDLQPELPYLEVLEFLTQVMTHKDGSEQRVALRKNPRQFFEWEVILDSGRERSRIHNLLFDWQARVFGIPMWHEATFTSAAVAINDLTISVRTTSFADYRVGGLALIYQDSTTFDVLEIDAAGVGATTLTFVNPVLHAYGTNVLVMPLRSGVVRPEIAGSRFASDAARLQLRFQVLDNDSNLGSVSGWTTTHNSKVVVDDFNSLNGSQAATEDFLTDIVTVGNAAGVPVFSTPWDKGKRRVDKTFWTKTKAGLWKVRQFLHSMRGRQVSFYLPTFGQDLIPAANLLLASSTLTITNVGYSRYVRERVPMNVIRVVFVNSATPSLIREVIGSTEIDANTEQLSLDATWPATYTPAEVKRIEYLQLSRFDIDAIRIRYSLGDRVVRVSSPVLTVFDE